MRFLCSMLACLALGGCASTVGLLTKDDKARPWFGVKTDGYLLSHPAELAEKSLWLPMVACPAAAIDLPFSLVADMIYWPIMSRGRTPATPATPP